VGFFPLFLDIPLLAVKADWVVLSVGFCSPRIDRPRLRLDRFTTVSTMDHPLAFVPSLTWT